MQVKLLRVLQQRTAPGNTICYETLPCKLRTGSAPKATVVSAEPGEIVPLKLAVEQAIDICGSVRKAATALKVDPSTIVHKAQNFRDEK